MADAAFDCLQEASHLVIIGWHLDTHRLAVFLDGAVGVAVGVVVDIAGNLLGKSVAHVTELLVLAVDFVGFVAVNTFPGVHFKVVCSPAFVGVHGT